MTSTRVKRRRRHGATSRNLLPGGLKPQPMPALPKPMLCTLVAEPFDHPDWIFEPKYDGLRILGRFDGKKLLLLSRYGAAQNFQFPDIEAALRESLSQSAIVDGEVVCFDERGHTTFRSLQQRFHLKNAAEVQARMKKYPAYVYLFDLLYLDRYDVTGLPLDERKPLLRDAVVWSDRVRWTPSHPEKGKEFWRQACRKHEEGIVGKDLKSTYVPRRSRSWVKIKCIGRQEFVIGGFTDPRGSRVGFGALLVGYYSDDGKRLIYAGKVGTGFSREILIDLRKRLDALEQEVSPFDEGDPPTGPDVHWVKPRLVAEIAFAEWTQNNLLRQPRFEGLRPDKKPKDIRHERPV